MWHTIKLPSMANEISDDHNIYAGFEIVEYVDSNYEDQDTYMYLCFYVIVIYATGQWLQQEP